MQVLRKEQGEYQTHLQLPGKRINMSVVLTVKQSFEDVFTITDRLY